MKIMKMKITTIQLVIITINVGTSTNQTTNDNHHATNNIINTIRLTGWVSTSASDGDPIMRRVAAAWLRPAPASLYAKEPSEIQRRSLPVGSQSVRPNALHQRWSR